MAAKRLRNDNADIDREVKYLSLVNHENIIKLYGITENKKSIIYIITEYADCGSLHEFLHVNTNAPNVTLVGKLNWILQCAKVIENYLYVGLIIYLIADSPLIYRLSNTCMQ